MTLKGIIMHYTGQIYRHPTEYDTPLLEITSGCSHNACSFCMMYKETKFSLSPLEHIKEDLEELQSCGVPFDRINLLNGDPFVLPTAKLVEIAKLIHEYLPSMKTITCYASIKNIKQKSLKDLEILREHGFNELHIGLETAYPPALALMNKGCTADEAYREVLKLKEAGMSYDALLMLGVAGKGKIKESIEATAKFLNHTKPFMISVISTMVGTGSMLEKYCETGEYREQSEGEMLLEEKLLLESIDYEEAYFFGSHPINLIPVSGSLQNKQELINKIDKALETLDKNILESIRERGALQA